MALWDNLAFVIGDDLDAAIASDEASIAQGLFEDAERSQSIVDNTKILQEYAAKKGVTLSSSNMGWNDGLTTALLSCFWMQDGPDIIQGEEQLPQFIDDGYIEPFPDDMAQRIRETCSPIAYKGLERDGKLYGIAIEPGLTHLYWNKALLRQAGYKDTDSVMTDGPADWAEWETVMEKVAAINGTSQAPYGGGVYVGAQMAGYLRVGALLDAAGSGYADATGAPAIDTDGAEAAFDFIRRQRIYNINGTCNSNDYFSTYDRAFSRGEIAFKVDGSWCAYELDALGIDYGCALIPPRTKGDDPGTLLIGACYMCVPTYSKHKEEAFYILEAMLDERIQTNIGKIGYRMPVLRSVIESEEYAAAQPVLSQYARHALQTDIPSLPAFRGNVSELWSAVGSAFGSAYNLAMTQEQIAGILSGSQSKMATAYGKK